MKYTVTLERMNVEYITTTVYAENRIDARNIAEERHPGWEFAYTQAHSLEPLDELDPKTASDRKEGEEHGH